MGARHRKPGRSGGMDSPMAYWLIVGPRSAQRPEIEAFRKWLLAQGKATRHAIGEVVDPDTIDDRG